MNTDKLWDEYIEVKDQAPSPERLKVLLECSRQSEDVRLQSISLFDLGKIHYNGDEIIACDKEKGKMLMKASADLGYGPAMNLYGQMLTHDGDIDAITYFRKSIESGEQVTIPAENLHTLYSAWQESGGEQLCEVIEEEIQILIDRCIKAIESDTDKNGVSALSLAVVGLYGLGRKQGINRSEGEKYLQKAIDCGNGEAKFLKQCPELLSPKTYDSFTGPSEDNLAKAKADLEDALAAAMSEKSNKAEKDIPTTSPDHPSAKTSIEKHKFGMFDFVLDLIIGTVLGAIAGGLIHLFFRTGFLIPFGIASVIFLILLLLLERE